MSSEPLIPEDYGTLLAAIRERIRRNLWYMRQLYLAYRDNPKLQPLVAEISWSHNLTILDRCKDDLEREFYLRMTRRMGWTRRVLVHQIENQTYEKTLLSQTNFADTLPRARRRAQRAPLRRPPTQQVRTFGIMALMEALKVRVENGKIIGEAPRGFADGTELELCLAEPDDEMTADELAALQAALDAGWRSMEAGRYRSAHEVVAEQRAKR
jgi:predicted nuclease of restriction endonuclease-like (RecB) superfamily